MNWRNGRAAALRSSGLRSSFASPDNQEVPSDVESIGFPGQRKTKDDPPEPWYEGTLSEVSLGDLFPPSATNKEGYVHLSRDADVHGFSGGDAEAGGEAQDRGRSRSSARRSAASSTSPSREASVVAQAFAQKDTRRTGSDHAYTHPGRGETGPLRSRRPTRRPPKRTSGWAWKRASRSTSFWTKQSGQKCRSSVPLPMISICPKSYPARTAN